MDKAVEAYNSAGGKEPAFNKNTAFNKNFGVAQNEVLEGSKLAEVLGIEYGGVLNNTNAKVAGKGYYDTANKKIYKCTSNTSINYADASYFVEVSNNDLLGKLENLNIIKMLVAGFYPTIPPERLVAGTQADGVATYDPNFSVPSGYMITGYEVYQDTAELSNQSTVTIVPGNKVRFVRRDQTKGFSVFAYMIKIKNL